ncbi:hypothetical protein J6590_010488 [Homalodisca vitripennis]|nr:hypothetical protein J6590_010488 [Homalodisca vitripennis]
MWKCIIAMLSIVTVSVYETEGRPHDFPINDDHGLYDFGHRINIHSTLKPPTKGPWQSVILDVGSIIDNTLIIVTCK